MKNKKIEEKDLEKKIREIAYRRIDYLMKREMASIAKWASFLTRKVIKIEKEVKKLKKNFY
ncbi:MAG: hypothetical protein QXI09_01780 [Candidatus Aenigmatarchaeota archaeon]